jgi:GNAT superfamily N-acetyltransferase
MSDLSVRLATPADRAAIDQVLVSSWGETRAAGHGRLWDLSTLPALVAERPGAGIVGVVTYEIEDGALEVVSIDADPPGGGTGTALLNAAANLAIAEGCVRLWLTTTNDNLDALRFYQRRGLHIIGVKLDGVADSRRLKPTIPQVGAYGIPIRDEIYLGRDL